MKILVTNDDGIRADGIISLANAAARAGHEVYVAAPNQQRSAASHSITLNRSLTAETVELPGICRAWAIDGTPADCVSLVLKHFCPDIEVVLSGINHGYNGGMDVMYSGTVAAAMEGAIMGRRALAVSLAYEREDTYDKAASLAMQILELTKEMHFPDYSVLNINYPAVDRAMGLKTVPLRLTKYDDHYVESTLPDGRTGYHLEGSMAPIEQHEEDDYSWLKRGYATVSVLTHEMTNHTATNTLAAYLTGNTGILF
ncbi:MAG: 5'/3'-nucleotidase SurE [Clostridia bacterium]|nr:5'/3'-nucleotidase SurE [Clostridia bacterium]